MRRDDSVQVSRPAHASLVPRRRPYSVIGIRHIDHEGSQRRRNPYYPKTLRNGCGQRQELFGDGVDSDEIQAVNSEQEARNVKG